MSNQDAATPIFANQYTDALFPGVFREAQTPELLEASKTRARLADAHEKHVTEQYGKNIRNMLGGGLAAGAGATALWYALRALKSPRKKDHKYDELNSGAPMVAKAAADGPSLDEIIGRSLPTGAAPLPSLPESGAGPKGDPYMFRPSWATAAGIGAGGLGLWGGKKLVDMIMARQKKKDNEAEIEAARQAYFAALRGEDKTAAALDAAYEKYVSHKKAQDGNTALNALSSAGDAAKALVTVPHTAGLLAMLATGLYGGKTMYDFTRARNQGDNYSKAQASRARMRGLPTVWVDPEELSRVKQKATMQAGVKTTEEDDE